MANRRLLYKDVTVKGTSYRKEVCQSFFDYIEAHPMTRISADCYNEPAGGDDFAEAVYIKTQRSTGLFKSEKKSFHIGYLPRNMAYALSKHGSKLKSGEITELDLIEYEHDPDEEYPYIFKVNVHAV